MKLNKFETIRESAKLAKKNTKKSAFNWLESGVEDNLTRDKNIEDLNKIKILPKLLKKIIKPDTTVKFFGSSLESPIFLAPMGHQTQWHKNGEIEMARGLNSKKILTFFGTQSRISLKDIRASNKNALLGWEIFPFGNKEWILEQISNAIKYKCAALCLCLDANVRSHRYQDREAYYDARKYGRRTNPISPDVSFALKYNWKLISWIKKKTKLPVIAKGILTSDDAKLAIENGCDAIWISNHGGRMFNSGISGIEALYEISKKMKSKKVKIIADGGIRRGSDILKYLCLGAHYVGVGRPALYGLINAGHEGVKKTFSILNSELKTSMSNGGFKNIREMKKDRLKINEKF